MQRERICTGQRWWSQLGHTEMWAAQSKGLLLRQTYRPVSPESVKTWVLLPGGREGYKYHGVTVWRAAEEQDGGWAVCEAEGLKVNRAGVLEFTKEEAAMVTTQEEWTSWFRESVCYITKYWSLIVLDRLVLVCSFLNIVATLLQHYMSEICQEWPLIVRCQHTSKCAQGAPA